MANERILINGVTKIEYKGTYIYLFPLAQITAFPNTDIGKGYYKVLLLESGITLPTVEFGDITDPLGAADIVEYVDALATAGYFFAIGQGGVVPPASLLDNRIVVKTEADFGIIDSTKEYFLDGFITVTGTGVNIPDGVKFNVRSYNFNLGGIVNIDINGKCVSGGAVGDILATDCSFSATDGVALDVISNTGNEAIEFNRVNFNGCSDAAMVIDNYRQLLIDGCGFFGGTPNIELRGLMNGARTTTTIARGISNSTIFFKAGAGFKMTGSFLTDLNIDLNATGVLCDFSEANFTDINIIPNVLKFRGARVFRNGVTNSDSTTAIPNISESSLASFWSENEGLNNTLIGGRVTVTTEVETVITTIDTYVNLLGTFTGEEEVHMESTATGTLKNLDNEQKEYLLFTGGKLKSTQDNMLKIAIFIFRDATSTEELVREETVTVDRLQGSRDVADANIVTRGILRANDYFFMKVKNLSSTANITGETSVFMLAVKI